MNIRYLWPLYWISLQLSSTELITVYQVFDELISESTCKIGKSWLFRDQSTQFNCEHHSADGSCGWCIRYRVTICRRFDANGFGGVVKWPDRNFRVKWCQSKVPVLHFTVNTEIMTSVVTEVKIETPARCRLGQVRAGRSERAAVKVWSSGSARTPF